MGVDVAGALWKDLASAPLNYAIAFAVPLALYVAVRRLSRSRRRRGSVRPIGYFSYITHSALPSVCATCGVEVPDKTKKFCLSNAEKFRGMVYCERHQRTW